MNIELSKHFHDKKNNVSLMEGYVEDLKNKKELYINKSYNFHLHNIIYVSRKIK